MTSMRRFKPLGVVGSLLRQPSRFGERLAEAQFEQRVDGEIGLGHRRSAGLRLDLRRSRRAAPKEPERQRPGLARGFGQTIARGERAPIRVDAQSECPRRE